MRELGSGDCPGCAQWSNRLLIVSLIGIAYLTLFPFRFAIGRLYSRAWPFFLGTPLKHGHHLDFFLNILLFVPLGFAFSAQLHKRGVKRLGAIVSTLAAGALTSYSVELLQFYIPTRSSGWDDVQSNSLGAVIGCLLFEFCGIAILGKLSEYETLFESYVSPVRTFTALLIYFAIWLGVSIPFQKQTRLSNWDEQTGIFVGNDASGEHPWKGRVSRLQIWNRALPNALAERISAGSSEIDANKNLLASYDFAAGAPYADQNKLAPAMTWISGSPATEHSERRPETDGSAWLGTTGSADALLRQIKNTNQFTFHVVCVPAGIHGTDGRLVSISQIDGYPNIDLRQQGTTLVLWFRNPLTEIHSDLTWYMPNILETGQLRDIVAAYDGADAFMYINGKKLPRSYRLSAAAALTHTFSDISTVNLGGYVIVYETLIFLPAGVLIGITARGWAVWKTADRLLVAGVLVLPPVLLELLLMSVSGRRILFENILFSLFFGVAGTWLSNADGQPANHPGADGQTTNGKPMLSPVRRDSIQV